MVGVTLSFLLSLHWKKRLWSPFLFSLAVPCCDSALANTDSNTPLTFVCSCRLNHRRSNFWFVHKIPWGYENVCRGQWIVVRKHTSSTRAAVREDKSFINEGLWSRQGHSAPQRTGQQGLEAGVICWGYIHQGGIWLELGRFGWIWITIEKRGRHSRQQGQQRKLRSRNVMQMSWYP